MQCGQCLQEKDEEQFPLKHGRRVSWSCKSCKHEYDRARYATPEGKAYHQEVARKVKAKVFAHYGGVCACCGEPDLRFLSLDHVNDDGKLHRQSPTGGSGTTFYRNLLRHGFPDEPKLRVMCFNCNLGRRVNGGACPHEEGK